MNFKQWFNEEVQGKTGLYPKSYGGIGLYPPQYFLSSEADAITYMSMDPRFKGMLKSGEGKPFSITHIKKK